jgi:hypothetical protein
MEIILFKQSGKPQEINDTITLQADDGTGGNISDRLYHRCFHLCFSGSLHLDVLPETA